MNQITPIERNNQRVLTTAQIAEAYETDVKVISKNFTRNKAREMGHVNHKYRPDRIGNLPHSFEVDFAGIRGVAGQEY